jgi:hypothetical protein
MIQTTLKLTRKHTSIRFSPQLRSGGGWNHSMSELTPESDSTGGKNKKKSTNTQSFAIQNYVALCFPSNQEIRRSKIKHLVKHNNKKLIFFRFVNILIINEKYANN